MDVAFWTGVVLFATATIGFFARLKKDVQEIHVLVNSHADAQAELIKLQGVRIDQLADALRTAGIDIPDRP